jgi:hypothetical protein
MKRNNEGIVITDVMKKVIMIVRRNRGREEVVMRRLRMISVIKWMLGDHKN